MAPFSPLGPSGSAFLHSLSMLRGLAAVSHARRAMLWRLGLFGDDARARQSEPHVPDAKPRRPRARTRGPRSSGAVSRCPASPP
eukprot:scaffold1141_cov369-Prasinococcus_capsulatus_cf.AAC.15